MKTIIILLLAATFSLSTRQPDPGFESRILGTVYPSNAIKKIAAINGKDSVFTNTSTGTFTIEVHAGNWKLAVLALPPYKDVVLENVVVQEGQDTDVGTIKLSRD